MKSLIEKYPSTASLACVLLFQVAWLLAFRLLRPGDHCQGWILYNIFGQLAAVLITDTILRWFRCHMWLAPLRSTANEVALQLFAAFSCALVSGVCYVVLIGWHRFLLPALALSVLGRVSVLVVLLLIRCVRPYYNVIGEKR